MLDELAGHGGDGRQAATVQQLSITHAVGPRSYITPPLSNGMDVGGLMRKKEEKSTCAYCLIHLQK